MQKPILTVAVLRGLALAIAARTDNDVRPYKFIGADARHDVRRAEQWVKRMQEFRNRPRGIKLPSENVNQPTEG